MAGKQIVGLDAQTPQRTDFVAQQDAAGTQAAQKSTVAELLALIETSDIADLPSVLADYQLLTGKNAASGYAGLNASAKLPVGTIDQASATAGQALLWSGSSWAPGDVATNLDQQAIFVSKTGNDSNDGLTSNKAKLTISAAIAAASGSGYGLVWVYDAGTYAEGVTNIDGIDLYAPNATLDLGSGGDQLRLAEQRTVFKIITRTSGGNSAVFNDASGGTSELYVERIVDSGAGVTVRNTFTTTLILHAGIIDVRGGGIALADFTNSGHIHAWISDIYLRSDGATGIQRSNAGLTVATVQHILLKDGATSTTALDCNAGTLDCNVLEINCATAYDVASGAALNLFCNDLNGTQTNAGTTNLVALNSDSSLGGDLTCVDLNATNAIANTLTVDGSELDPTGHTAGDLLISDGTDFTANSYWEDWITPTKEGTWDDAAGQAVIRYRRSRDQQFVVISGYAEKGSAGLLFNLPAGYRPSANTYNTIFGRGSIAGSGAKRLLIESTGDIKVMSGSDGFDGTSDTWVSFTTLIPIV